MDWQQTIGSWGTTLLNGYTNAKFVQPYEVQKLQLQALGQDGLYNEGQPGVYVPPPAINSTTLLLIGAAVVAFMVMSKD